MAIQGKKSDQKQLLKAAEVMKLLSHPVRLSILCDLMHHGEMGAGEIVEAQKNLASQSQVSQYLAEFRKLKYVRAEKRGQNVSYTFSSPLIEKIITLLYESYCAKKNP